METRDFTAERPAIGYYMPSLEFAAIPEHVCLMSEDQPGGGTPLAVCGPAGDADSEAFARQLLARWNACADALALLDAVWVCGRELTKPENEVLAILRRAIYGDEGVSDGQ